MANNYFRFKKFTIQQDKSPFRVGVDGVILGASADLPMQGKILDAGTGTGLIALMAAQRTCCTIVAVEPDHDAFLQAAENFGLSPWRERLKAENMTLKSYADMEKPHSFDCLISNPPYFRNSMKGPDEALSRARHSEYLSAGELLEGASKLLTAEGSLQVILPFREGNEFIAEASDMKFYCNNIVKIITKPGAFSKRVVLKFERIKRLLVEKSLPLHAAKGYSPEFISLTKDFYPGF